MSTGKAAKRGANKQKPPFHKSIIPDMYGFRLTAADVDGVNSFLSANPDFEPITIADLFRKLLVAANAVSLQPSYANGVLAKGTLQIDSNRLTIDNAQLLTDVSELTVQLEKCKGDANRANKGLQALGLLHDELTTRFAELEKEHFQQLSNGQPMHWLREIPDYLELKFELEGALPQLFNDTTVERIELTDEQFIALLTDYSRRDPSKEFPYQPIAEQYYQTFKAKQNEQQEETP